LVHHIDHVVGNILTASAMGGRKAVSPFDETGRGSLNKREMLATDTDSMPKVVERQGTTNKQREKSNDVLPTKAIGMRKEQRRELTIANQAIFWSTQPETKNTSC
jgi:hypothetical protein